MGMAMALARRAEARSPLAVERSVAELPAVEPWAVEPWVAERGEYPRRLEARCARPKRALTVARSR